jgi:hypothetical protein
VTLPQTCFRHNITTVRSRGSIPGRSGNVSFSTASKPSLGTTYPPIQWMPEVPNSGVKRPGPEAVPWSSMACWLLKHGDGFTFCRCTISNATWLLCLKAVSQYLLGVTEENRTLLYSRSPGRIRNRVFWNTNNSTAKFRQSSEELNFVHARHDVLILKSSCAFQMRSHGAPVVPLGGLTLTQSV